MPRTEPKRILVEYHGNKDDSTPGDFTIRSARLELNCKGVARSSLRRALELLEHPAEEHREVLLGKVLSNDIFLWTNFRDTRLKIMPTGENELFEVSLDEDEASSLAAGLKGFVEQ